VQPHEGVHVVNNTDAILKCTLCVIPGVSFTWVKSGQIITWQNECYGLLARHCES
jgi:hypothetical protein